MTAFIASLIDHVTVIAACGWAAYWYANRKEKAGQKKKAWLVPTLCVIIVYHMIALCIDLPSDLTPSPRPAVAQAEKIPTSEDYKAMFKDGAKTATEEVAVSVPGGPFITIPKGFKYATSTATAARLAATGRNGEYIVLLHLGQSSDLAALEKKYRAELKPDDTMKLGPSHAEVINGCDSLVMDVSDPKRDLFGKILIVTNGKDAYSLFAAGPKVLERVEEAQTFKLLHSVEAAVR